MTSVQMVGSAREGTMQPSPLRRSPDFLVVGGGVIGIALALELKRRHRGERVTLIEKEAGCGQHASGRNSGVLHAGFYYTADSLKAKFTRDGNRMLSAYCDDRGLRIDRCGKLVVARDASELAGLEELLRRARVNGVALDEISAAEAREIEPRVKTFERALFSPSTASVDPSAVVASLVRDALAEGVVILAGTEYRSRALGGVRTSAGTISAGYVINAAGVYADRIARDFGFSERYRMLPFKGLYLYGDADAPSFRTHIYPVPDLRNPFLGVHFTRTMQGGAKIGPTATPAFWREHYGGLENFSLGECADIVSREAGLFLRNDFNFRRMAVDELRKYNRRNLVARAALLAEGVQPEHFRRWGRPGIRAQLIDVQSNKLEMDFRYEGDDHSFHVLNAVSPAFTCSLPFAAFLADRIEEKVH